MKPLLPLAILSMTLAMSFAPAQEEKDVKGASDHPLFTRMPGYYISDYEVKDFDKYTSAYLSGKDQNWEGKVTRIEYYVKTGAQQASMLQVARNYETALKKISGKVLAKEDRVIEGKLERGGAVTYVHVEAFNEGRNYNVTVVETQPMKQDVVADAATLGAGIAALGKIAVYGIYFDTGKSIVKPESNPTLEEIAKLLRQNTTLSLFVVGHTDYVGSLENNLKLSSDRADAVVKALVSRGIAASRLKAGGVGPYCPVASNRTEEGIGRNRRVELVEQSR